MAELEVQEVPSEEARTVAVLLVPLVLEPASLLLMEHLGLQLLQPAVPAVQIMSLSMMSPMETIHMLQWDNQVKYLPHLMELLGTIDHLAHHLISLESLTETVNS